MRLVFLGAVLAMIWGPAQGQEPGFDCKKAESAAETLICRDARLAALDWEMTRLYALARDGSHMHEERRDELVALQRAWLAGRDLCAGGAEPALCTGDAYALRIHQLRQGYFDARQDDAAGISDGPLLLECDGLDALIGLTFISSDPPLAYLEWRNSSVVLELAPSGSGARYTRAESDGAWQLWIKGEAASFEMSDGRALACRFGETG
jgi:uncharacterized protein